MIISLFSDDEDDAHADDSNNNTKVDSKILITTLSPQAQEFCVLVIPNWKTTVLFFCPSTEQHVSKDPSSSIIIYKKKNYYYAIYYSSSWVRLALQFFSAIKVREDTEVED